MKQHAAHIAFNLYLFAVLAGLVFFASYCAEREQPPTPDEQIKGAWSRDWAPFSATTNYSFDGNGQCLTKVIVAGLPVQEYTYAYYFRGDTLTMIDLATAPPFQDVNRAVVEFTTDSTAVLVWIGWVNYYLVRID